MKELELLEAVAQDWKAVRPLIFGNIFESAIGKSNSKELDPACGSGNFLYMAYLELKLGEGVTEQG